VFRLDCSSSVKTDFYHACICFLEQNYLSFKMFECMLLSFIIFPPVVQNVLGNSLIMAGFVKVCTIHHNLINIQLLIISQMTVFWISSLPVFCIVKWSQYIRYLYHFQVFYEGLTDTLNVQKPYWLMDDGNIQISQNSSSIVVSTHYLQWYVICGMFSVNMYVEYRATRGVKDVVLQYLMMRYIVFH
jgi:hypothetical protein